MIALKAQVASSIDSANGIIAGFGRFGSPTGAHNFVASANEVRVTHVPDVLPFGQKQTRIGVSGIIRWGVVGVVLSKA